MKHQVLAIVAVALLAGPMAAETSSISAFSRPGATATLLFDVNNHGILVGFSQTGPTDFFQAFVFDGTSFTTLFPPGALGSNATGVNDGGTVVGSYFDSTVTDEFGNVLPGPQHGFIYEGGIYTTLDAPGAIATNPRGISPDGRYISGYYEIDAGFPGFVYDRAGGTFTIVSKPNSLLTIAQGINSSGILVGSDILIGPPTTRPGFFYDIATNTRTDVTIAGALRTALRDIDDAGNVAGFFNDGASFHGFVGSVSSYEQIDYPGAAGTFIEGMNNAGVLVGNANIGDPSLGLSIAFVVTQDSDPAALLEELAADVTGVGPGESLANKVKLAQVYYAANDIQATCAVLTGFVAEVRAQRGKKKISATLADQLIADAQAIMTAIGCN
jgi:hypothetical protein